MISYLLSEGGGPLNAIVKRRMDIYLSQYKYIKRGRMNPISSNVKTGTIGELLVQIRLLQYEVQSAPPIKDSGNDLIGLKGRVVKSIQVKTTTTNRFKKCKLPNTCDILAIVFLKGGDHEIYLDNSEVFFIPCDIAKSIQWTPERLTEYRASVELVSNIFCLNDNCS